MATTEIDMIKQRATHLTVEEKSELIAYLERELRPTNGASKQLEFGRYSSTDRSMSNEEDFHIAEWRPADLDLNRD